MITHTLMFSQGSGQTLRWIELELNGDSDAESNPKVIEGKRWRQRDSSPEGIDLYPNFSAEDKKRLIWRWDSSEHGGLIQLGIDTPYRTVQGRTVESYYKVWFSFRGAKRLTSGQFRVAGYNPQADLYTDAEGVGIYELAGSSNTFQAGEGQWTVSRYSR
jgi:hypothetical protein